MWEIWIERYGYLAVFIGTLLEGETILVLAGYSVSREYLDPLPTYLLAVAGCTLGDSIYFWLGRRYGGYVLREFPSIRPLRARAVLIVRRWGRTAAFAMRFAYGLRFVLPVLLGASRMRARTFHAFNLLGALAFAAVYVGVGFLFGEAVQRLFERVRPYETRILAGLVVLGLLFWAVREWRLYRAIPPEVERELDQEDVPLL